MAVVVGVFGPVRDPGVIRIGVKGIGAPGRFPIVGEAVIVVAIHEGPSRLCGSPEGAHVDSAAVGIRLSTHVQKGVPCIDARRTVSEVDVVIRRPRGVVSGPTGSTNLGSTARIPSTARTVAPFRFMMPSIPPSMSA